MGSFSSHHEYTFHQSPTCRIDFDENDPRSPYPNRTPLSKAVRQIIEEQPPIDERDPRSPQIGRTPFEQLSLKEKEEFVPSATPLTATALDTEEIIKKVDEVEIQPIPLLLESPIVTPVSSLRKRRNADKFNQTVTPRYSRREKQIVIVTNDKENKINGTGVSKAKREPFSPLENSPRSSPSKRVSVLSPSPMTKKRRQNTIRSDAEFILSSGEFV